jgi:GTP-binding protein
VALLLVDALEGITDQDAHVAGYALERGRGLILVFNKWDAVKDKNDTRRRILDAMDLKLKFLAFCPHVMVSAKTGLGCHRLFPLVNEVYAQYTFRAPTGRLNRILEEAVAAHQPPYAGRTRLKFYYGTQASTRPPTFVLFANKPDEVHFSYQRYLVNTFRTALGLDKTPLKVILRPRRKESK